MFGYITPDKENLLVKEATLYKSTYCGLCSIIKEKISLFLPLTLSYDFVFLAMLRATVNGTEISVSKGNCKYNPIKKCVYAIPKNDAEITAFCSLVLTYYKIVDDLNDRDTHFCKRILYLPFKAYLKNKLNKLYKRDLEYARLGNIVNQKLSELSELEKSFCDNIDLMSHKFGELMAEVASFKISDKSKKIVSEIGFSIGNYIYIADAVDDIIKDENNSSYNPLLAKYLSVETAIENFRSLDIALSMYTKNAIMAFNLLDKSEYTSILNNILTLGLGKKIYNIMTETEIKND